ncbi:MAG: aminotransferase class V-fold PLP-dependent enzyme [Clostridium sp.]|nr:aminotransferase class V-fold PLP-dependent enzyme [Clostridium sp.]
MVYLDNAATSYPKPRIVYNEIQKCMQEYCANPGRGGHRMSISSGSAVFKARETAAEFFKIGNPLRLAFTKNATEALNIAIKGVLRKGDHVITTSMEHNAVIRPLKEMEKEEIIELALVWGNNFGEIDSKHIKKSIRPNTKLIISTLSSNVNGTIMPIKEIGEIAKEKGILFLVDASQGAGSQRIDVEDIYADMLAFPGHKGLMGPQGTGGLYVRDGIKIKPIMWGGTGSDSHSYYQPDIFPDMLESGTLNTPGIVGLGYGIKFIGDLGIDNIQKHKYTLLKRIYDGISHLKGIEIYSIPDEGKNSGIMAFNFKGVNSPKVSDMLDKKYGIASRAGLHCSPLAHETIGTSTMGAVRLSVGFFNTTEDIDIAVNALVEISKSIQAGYV